MGHAEFCRSFAGNLLNTYPELLLLLLGNILDMSKRFFGRRVECAKRSWRFSTFTRIISVLHSYNYVTSHNWQTFTSNVNGNKDLFNYVSSRGCGNRSTLFQKGVRPKLRQNWKAQVEGVKTKQINMIYHRNTELILVKNLTRKLIQKLKGLKSNSVQKRNWLSK